MTQTILIFFAALTGPMIGMLLVQFVIRQFQKRKNRREALQHQKDLDKMVKEIREAHDSSVLLFKQR